MFIIPLESLCNENSELKQMLSDSVGIKVSEFDADGGKEAPYVCWQIINANTQQYLADNSDMDEILVQIDIYANKKSECRKIAKLVRSVISESCYIENYSGIIKESETNLFRIHIDTNWFEES
ncbi:DUF3168 domain-containing protein [Acinetobacter guillouiae]|uniref:tail completion protein gp17 n=1 Tax=Acinetobacter guillouiae TaxID=106649 RepID=UPI003AF8C955